MPLKIRHTDGNEPQPAPTMPETTPVLELPPEDVLPDGGEPDTSAASFLASMRALFADARAELEPGDVLDGGADDSDAADPEVA